MTIAIGVDVGTTGSRAVAVDERGAVVVAQTSEYPLLTPHPQWTEQEPAEWWRATREVLAAVARACDGEIVGIGLTGQMHGSVFLDRDGEVIRPALLWNDQRTGAQCEEITERVGPQRIVEITGNPALTGFQAPKVLWLRDEEPANFERVAHVLLPKDYVRYRLSHELATDAADASGTLFLDLRARTWSREVLDALEVPAEWLPAVFEGPESTGTVAGDVAAELGLPAGIPIAAGGGDNSAAAIGTAVTRDGLMSSSIGTSGVLFARISAPWTRRAGSTPSPTRCLAGTACSPSRSRRADRCAGGATSRAWVTRSSSPKPRQFRPAARGSCSCPT
jgi:xylulokinase